MACVSGILPELSIKECIIHVIMVQLIVNIVLHSLSDSSAEAKCQSIAYFHNVFSNIRV